MYLYSDSVKVTLGQSQTHPTSIPLTESEYKYCMSDLQLQNLDTTCCKVFMHKSQLLQSARQNEMLYLMKMKCCTDGIHEDEKSHSAISVAIGKGTFLLLAITDYDSNFDPLVD